MSEATGRVVLITGGSRGIGLAIALRAAQDGALIAIAASGRHGVLQSGPAFEFGIADGRTDRVDVRVAVADDQGFAHESVPPAWRPPNPASIATHQ